MKPLFADSRPLDERARQKFGLSTDTMMEHAAAALEEAVRRALFRFSEAAGDGSLSGAQSVEKAPDTFKAYGRDSLSGVESAEKAPDAFKACGRSSLSGVESADKASSAFKAYGRDSLSGVQSVEKAEAACKACASGSLSEAASAEKASSAFKACASDSLSGAPSADKESASCKACAPGSLSSASSDNKACSAFKAAGAPRVLIVCGSGDNGGDGYALARRLLAPDSLSGAPSADKASSAFKAAGAESLSGTPYAEKASSAFKAAGALSPESVVVFAARPPKSAACIAQAERAVKAGACIVTELPALKAVSADSGIAVVVDCLFGSGFHGAPDDATAALIEKLNALDAWKIACDIPSCLPFLAASSSGAASTDKAASAFKAGAPVFRADETITMGALKSVLFEDFAKDWTGAVTCAPLGVSRNQFEAPSASGPAPEGWLLEDSDLALPHRTKQNSNKGTYGHAAIVVGDKCGAGIIAGTAALTYGAGLVTLVTDRDLAAPEFLRQAQSADKYAEGVCMLMQSPSLPENTTAVALGMGLGRDEAAIARGQIFLDELMKRPEAGVVIDADMCYHPGVSAFLKARATCLESAHMSAGAGAADKSGAGCESAACLESAHRPASEYFRTVITPHPKEFSALLDLCGLGTFSVKEIQSRRLEFARLFASAYPGVVLILKGANPVIACASGSSACDVLVNPLGMPCLAKAGSGDVLAGLTAALLAQGWGAFEAAKQASLAHTCASRRIKNDFAMTPFSLMEEIAHL